MTKSYPTPSFFSHTPSTETNITFTNTHTHQHNTRKLSDIPIPDSFWFTAWNLWTWRLNLTIREQTALLGECLRSFWNDDLACNHFGWWQLCSQTSLLSLRMPGWWLRADNFISMKDCCDRGWFYSWSWWMLLSISHIQLYCLGSSFQSWKRSA